VNCETAINLSRPAFDSPEECKIIQRELPCEGLKFATLRAFAGNQQSNVRKRLHCVQQIGDPLLPRETPEVKDRRRHTGMWLLLQRETLEVRQDFNARTRPAILDEFLFHELARSDEQVHAPLIRGQPAVQVSLRGKYNRRSGSPE